MKKQYLVAISLVLVLILSGVFLASCGSSTNSPSSTSPLDGKGLMEQRCTVCHSTARITSAHMTAAEWTDTVQSMIARGAQLSASEQQTLIGYLSATYK